ncbi:hypothetical protein QYM36_011913 [Artemia franciscana]|uniref:Uncharacterized protein n=1 Tax=Artemia franciscana TaxID=6661 RepID=A0AA88HK51_ARTSF|nr:hypothetical protein QYM36_011913 [Artemia franciscana]
MCRELMCRLTPDENIQTFTLSSSVFAGGDEYYGFSEDQVRETFQQLPEDLRAIAEAQESLEIIPSIDSEPYVMPAKTGAPPMEKSVWHDAREEIVGDKHSVNPVTVVNTTKKFDFELAKKQFAQTSTITVSDEENET